MEKFSSCLIMLGIFDTIMCLWIGRKRKTVQQSSKICQVDVQGTVRNAIRYVT